MTFQKYFNVAGPCHPDEHYMLPAQERCRGLLRLVDRKQYFVIHAARQSGKTTLLLDLARQLNEAGDYHALYCSLETAQGITKAEKGIPVVVNSLRKQVKFHHRLSEFPFAENVAHSDYANVLQEALAYFCISLDKPLVVLFDEVDCLSNGTLISFLRQLRSGYVTRGQTPFPHSVALVGMRNIRDCEARVREERNILGSASPFNIVSEVLTLRNFDQEETVKLYAQHTAQAKQAFPPVVVERAYHYTQGQPWLVNAIAREIVEKILDFDLSRPITAAHVERAAQTLAIRRDTHIDSLLERLKEARVQKIVEPVIIGEGAGLDPYDDDYQYVLDLGLLREGESGALTPSNPIYGEVIVRALGMISQRELDKRAFPLAPAYLRDGKLDMRRLLGDFQQFWRENSEIWVERFQYKEAAPHLILQAFLQRVVNAGGRISREMAEGTRRLDLCIHYQNSDYPIELKLRYGEKTYQEGRKQLAGYVDRMGCDEGWLIVFDRRKEPSWSEKIFWRTEQEAGKMIHVVGC